jgi:hypothetical protein
MRRWRILAHRLFQPCAPLAHFARIFGAHAHRFWRTRALWRTNISVRVCANDEHAQTRTDFGAHKIFPRIWRTGFATPVIWEIAVICGHACECFVQRLMRFHSKMGWASWAILVRIAPTSMPPSGTAWNKSSAFRRSSARAAGRIHRNADDLERTLS